LRAPDYQNPHWPPADLWRKTTFLPPTFLANSCLFAAPILDSEQAIDKLEELLNGGLSAGQQNMFGPKEYVQIYT
jgi:hypothetical protein